MSVTKIVISYVLTLLVFLAVDFFWLGFLAKGLYNKYLGNFLSSQVNWTAAIIFYCLFVVGVLIFVVYPAVGKDSLLTAVVLGALFGMFTYATYDLTNLATLKDWPVLIVIIDIAWGAFLSAVVSTAGFYIVRYFS